MLYTPLYISSGLGAMVVLGGAMYGGTSMGKCECGCGAEVKGRFLRGHVHRVKRQDYGLCRCGCGEQASNAFGYAAGHQSRTNTGSKNSQWKGGRVSMGDYIGLKMPDHPRANSAGYVHEHIVVMESMLGGPIPDGMVVHHRDGNGKHNHPRNLMLMAGGHTAHGQLHADQRALAACGHPHWRQCWICHQYDDPVNLSRVGRGHRHSSCFAEYQRERRRRKQEA